MLKVGTTIFETTEENDASLIIRSLAKIGGTFTYQSEEHSVNSGALYKVASDVLAEIENLTGSDMVTYSANGMVVTTTLPLLRNAASSIATSSSDENEDIAFQNELRNKLADISVAIAAVTTLIINV